MPDPGARLAVTQVALGRFHHFNLARQLEMHGRLAAIWTGYPRAKLRDESGIPPGKIRTFPWLYVPTQLLPRVPVIGGSQRLQRAMHWRAIEAIDRHVARRLRDVTVLVGLSSGGLHSGRRAQALGGRFVCDRGSTHIRAQNAILKEEYRRWGLSFAGIDPRVIAKEEAEYAAADRITIPSDFCRRTFIDQGVPPEKLRVIPYGARLDRFSVEGEPDPDSFVLLFVGGVSVRKGVPDLLEGFARLRHPRKRLRIIGAMQPDMAALLPRLPTEHVEIVGPVPNDQLRRQYSTADALVLPSLEEGLALVMAEAMASGCPVIATENSGARNLFTDEVDGLIVPARSPHALCAAFERLAQDRPAARALAAAARTRVETLGGYDEYGARWEALLVELDASL